MRSTGLQSPLEHSLSSHDPLLFICKVSVTELQELKIYMSFPIKLSFNQSSYHNSQVHRFTLCFSLSTFIKHVCFSIKHVAISLAFLSSQQSTIKFHQFNWIIVPQLNQNIVKLQNTTQMSDKCTLSYIKISLQMYNWRSKQNTLNIERQLYITLSLKRKLHSIQWIGCMCSTN